MELTNPNRAQFIFYFFSRRFISALIKRLCEIKFFDFDFDFECKALSRHDVSPTYHKESKYPTCHPKLH